jgi:hypothetical protein
MTAKRTPVKRPQRRRVSPAAVELFRQLRATEDKDEWWRLHNALHDELQCKPWEWPCVVAPDEKRPPYEEATRLVQAQTLYQLLAAAAR